jgi:predicted ArsR family transcriptional regulator
VAEGSSTERGGVSDDFAAAAALHDPVRLALYRFTVGQVGSVSRDEAAEAIGIRREMAAFHLDRLVDAGLLDVEFRRLSGKQGPGAGRPAKLYRRSTRQVQVSLPPRRYDIAAGLFAAALGDPKAPRQALSTVARQLGETSGRHARERAGRAPRGRRLLDSLMTVLSDWGYEPSVDDGDVVLRNCPFDDLRKYDDIVCRTMNRALIEGLVAGSGSDDLFATFHRQPPGCCMLVSKKATKASSSRR